MIGLALALLLQASPVAAESAEADRLFEVGQSLVAEGDTAGAVAAWHGALATGWASAAAEHNLGTVALARGDLGRARLHLERAARLAPRDSAVARNLGIARDRAGLPAPAAASRAVAGLVAVIPAVGWVALALALAFGALALWLTDRRRPAAIVGLLAVVGVGVAAAAVWQATAPRGVVLASAVVVEAPGGREVARLQPAESVWVGEAEGGWRAVRVGRTRGWVRAEAVAAIAG